MNNFITGKVVSGETDELNNNITLDIDTGSNEESEDNNIGEEVSIEDNIENPKITEDSQTTDEPNDNITLDNNIGGGEGGLDIDVSSGEGSLEEVFEVIEINYEDIDLSGDVSIGDIINLDPTLITIPDVTVGITSNNITSEVNFTHLSLENLDRQVGMNLVRRTDSVASFDDDNSLAYFDGVDDYVGVGSDSSLTPSEFSLSAWVKADSIGGSFKVVLATYDCILGMGISYFGYELVLHPTSGLGFYIGDGDTTPSLIFDGTDNFGSGEWRHIGVTYNGSYGQMYIDGISVVNGALPAIVYSSTNHTVIGDNTGSGFCTDEPFNGTIDKVEIWNTSLSAGDISTLYADGRKATTQRNSSFMVSQWLFDDTLMILHMLMQQIRKELIMELLKEMQIILMMLLV